MNQKHAFHLVDPSPLPFVSATAALSITSSAVMLFHGYLNFSFGLFCGFSLLFFTMFTLLRDVVRESTFEGQHTSMVHLGLRFGMLLFIVSEVMFFFAFFLAFFLASFAPVPEIGSVLPPKGIEVLSALEIPFLNTIILLTSGATCTLSHHAIVVGNKEQARISLILTVVLAIIFTGCQAFEYVNAPFSISDSVYGSTFYMATGFHGFHVFIGTCFLTVCLARLVQNHFTTRHHFGFEAAALYLHFVDVVLLFLFVAVYLLGGL